MSVLALAEGIVRIANANMERAVRVVSVQRGFDPRDFALLAFGGAGGLHACELAASLDIATVLVPEHSGVLSALGMLLADVAKDYSASVLCASDQLTQDDLQARLQLLTERARNDLGAEGFASDEITLAASLAMRYEGQAFEIDVPLPQDFLDAEFHRRHAKLYGYSNPQRATEAVQLRLRATGRTAKPVLAFAKEVESRALPEPDSLRTAVFGKRRLSTPIFHRGRLAPGMGGPGPAILVTGESTNVIPPGWVWRIDGAGTLVATFVDAKTRRGGHRGR
jgi:N-methylhydantoinase A/oxoprolinase/acetone carboxylase beta subunit